MTILYKVTNDKKFDSTVEWFLDINIEKNEVEWICYPHAPKGMHPRHADSYQLGAKHHNGRQLLSDFYLKPKYELDKITHRIIHTIIDNYENDVNNLKKLNSLLGTNTFSFDRIGKHIYPWYRCTLNDSVLFKIEKLTELEIIRLDLLVLAFSENIL